EQVPQLINSGQLQQLAAGAPALPALPQPQAQAPIPQAQASYTQPQGAPQPPPQQQAGFSPGARVVVVAQDGNRYPAPIVQAGPGQYLCQMPNNQSYWFPAQSVFPG